MTVAGLQQALSLTPVVLPQPERTIRGGYTGDLLSRVMSRAKEGDVWITIMSNLNVVAVASLVEVAAVVFAEGVQPSAEMVSAAQERGINLLASGKSSFELCRELARFV